MKVPLHVGLGGRPAADLRVGVDEGQVLALPFGERGRLAGRSGGIHSSCPTFGGTGLANVRDRVELHQPERAEPQAVPAGAGPPGRRSGSNECGDCRAGREPAVSGDAHRAPFLRRRSGPATVGSAAHKLTDREEALDEPCCVGKAATGVRFAGAECQPTDSRTLRVLMPIPSHG